MESACSRWSLERDPSEKGRTGSPSPALATYSAWHGVRWFVDLSLCLPWAAARYTAPPVSTSPERSSRTSRRRRLQRGPPTVSVPAQHRNQAASTQGRPGVARVVGTPAGRFSPGLPAVAVIGRTASNYWHCSLAGSHVLHARGGSTWT